jgi:hypothetical protein
MPNQGEVLDFLKTQYGNYLAYFGNDPLAANEAFMENYGINGAMYSQAGGNLQGMGSFFTGMAGNVLTEFNKVNRKSTTAQLVQTINARLKEDKQFINAKEIRTTLAGLTQEEFDAFAEFILDNADNKKINLQDGKLRIFGSKEPKFLTPTDIGPIYDEGGRNVFDALPDLATIFDKETEQAIRTIISNVGNTLFAKPSWLDTAPEWFTKEAFDALIAGGDTTTPRGSTSSGTSSRTSSGTPIADFVGGSGDTTSSRLYATMARHRQFDSMLAGSRFVTSSFRTGNLGSINSDHITGRAYDLVGQNLGNYKTIVERNGGFAEFHGVNGSRHLHVVPGSNAVGDSTTPVAASTGTMRSSGGDGNNYYFTITGGPYANAEDVANMVMAKIKVAERSIRERR